jgi:hypothetical protein
MSRFSLLFRVRQIEAAPLLLAVGTEDEDENEDEDEDENEDEDEPVTCEATVAFSSKA